MTKKQIILEFLKKSVLILFVTFVLFNTAKAICTTEEGTDYFVVALICGFPFGVRRMFVWHNPNVPSLSGSVGIVIFDLISAGIIGSFVLAWQLLVALYYIPLTIIRLINFNKTANNTIQP